MGATKALAIELAKRNITVNCVAPGLIDTDMLPGSARRSDEDDSHEAAGPGQEVAGLVAFLLGEEAAYITRQVISVNGGMV
jgi:3-oxoacyl-[acyl-carrier protein] reductase